MTITQKDLDIAEVLRHGNADEIYGCLIGMGEADLAQRFQMAAKTERIASERYDEMPTREATPDEADDLGALIHVTVPLDPEVESRLYEDRKAAMDQLDAVTQIIKGMADRLTSGHDYAPS